MLGPFAKRTHGIDDATVRKIALFAFAVATAAVVIGAFVGRSLLFNWNVSIAAMAITGGSEIRRGDGRQLHPRRNGHVLPQVREGRRVRKFNHDRELAPIDKQTVIRMNRDTLYSFKIPEAQPVK